MRLDISVNVVEFMQRVQRPNLRESVCFDLCDAFYLRNTYNLQDDAQRSAGCKLALGHALAQFISNHPSTSGYEKN